MVWLMLWGGSRTIYMIRQMFPGSNLYSIYMYRFSTTCTTSGTGSTVGNPDRDLSETGDVSRVRQVGVRNYTLQQVQTIESASLRYFIFTYAYCRGCQ